MKVSLSVEQLEFLKDRLSISKDNINKMNAEEWRDIREKCFYIETDEMLKCKEGYDACDTYEFRMASSIVDAKYQN